MNKIYIFVHSLGKQVFVHFLSFLFAIQNSTTILYYETLKFITNQYCSFMKSSMRLGVFLLGAMSLYSSCIDKDYDLNDVDLTMGLGSEGLGVKIGETEKIFLENILEVDHNVKLDQNNLYYLVEDGTFSYDFHVDKLKSKLNMAVIKPLKRVLSFEQVLEQHPGFPGTIESIDIAAGSVVAGHAKGSDRMNVKVDGISSDIKRVQRIYCENTTMSIAVEMVNSPGMHFDISSFENFRITVPEYIHISRINTLGWTQNGHVLEYKGKLPYRQKELCSVVVDYVDLHECGVPVDGNIILDEKVAHVEFECDVEFKTTDGFVMHKGDYADMNVCILNNGGNAGLTINALTGRFDPDIQIAPQRIDIASSLPDFLKDEKDRIKVTNPTIRIQSDLTQIPVGLHMAAQLNSVKEGADGFTVPVALPQMALDGGQNNTIYYYQGDAPYDPEGVTSQTGMQKVNNLSSLLYHLPDYILVDFGQGKLSLQDKDYTLQLGRTYSSRMDYKIFVPFEFDNGFCIVYNDSTDSFGDDLADYTAEGLTLTAEAYNTIPLDLVVHVYAVDVNNRCLEEIRFNEAEIAPSADGANAERTEVTVSARLDDPTLLQKIDRLMFRIEAESKNMKVPHKLLSTQYLQFKEIRLNLDGQVTGNFN